MMGKFKGKKRAGRRKKSWVVSQLSKQHKGVDQSHERRTTVSFGQTGTSLLYWPPTFSDGVALSEEEDTTYYK